jgi:hypothetical protein
VILRAGALAHTTLSSASYFWEEPVPRGANQKREREYEELKTKFHKSGRYGNRADEVAARIVNKQRAQYGETKGEKREEREGKNPDKNLPLDHYRHLTIGQLKPRLQSLSKMRSEKDKAIRRKAQIP